jgi:predicted oxidoreductase
VSASLVAHDTTSFDVVVVGAGAAGVSCAIEAARASATVALVDASGTVGGTAGVAGGGTCIAGSALQRSLGLDDSPAIALEDWIEWGGDTVDVAWASRYLEASESELFDKLAGIGVKWIAAHPREGNRVPRWHQPAGGGAAVMQCLETVARTLPSIQWFLGHSVDRLVVAGGRATGVSATSAGRSHELRARSVVFASGGFNNNHEMVVEHATAASTAERILLGGGLGARGEGHRILTDVSAAFAQMDAVWMFPYGTPDHRRPESHRGLAIRGIDGDVWINDDGVRFHDESLRSGATGTRALLEQPNGRCWSVIDSAIASRMTIADPYYRHRAQPIRERIEEFLETSPYVVRAERREDLADRIGVDPTALQDSLSRFNSEVVAGLERDTDVGRRLGGLEAIDRPPYYAVRFHPVARKNLGGVVTDLDCRVIAVDGAPIEGLFAAGEVAGMAGGRINGRAALEGTSFGPSVFSGAVAGRNVVA